MRHRLRPIPVLLMAFTVSALVAQTPSGWSQVLLLPQAHVLVQARVVTVDGNPCLQFRNEGQDPVHFHFGVNGADPYTSPRVHLNVHKRSPYLPLPAGVSVQALKLALVRAGSDQGDVEPED